MGKLAYMVPAGAGNPAWSNDDKSAIDVDVVFPHLGGEKVRYTATKSDPEWEHSEEIFSRAAAGEFGDIGPYVPLPPKIPAIISDRQFALGLALKKLISEEEALAWVSGGVVPAAIAAYVDLMPPDQRFATRMLLSGATEFRRDSPLTAAFGQQTGMSDADVDQFWLWCSTL